MFPKNVLEVYNMDNSLVLQETDRIVEINGFSFPQQDDYNPNRRNVICYSEKLSNYIRLHNLHSHEHEHLVKIMKYVNRRSYGSYSFRAVFDDIKVMQIAGFY